MTARQKQIDQFLNEAWHVGCWTALLLLVAIWVGLILQFQVSPGPRDPAPIPRMSMDAVGG